MLTFHIHLNTIDDFRQYAAMEAMFQMRGYVITRGKWIDIYDLLGLMMRGPLHKAKLVLTQYQESDKERITEFLETAGLLDVNYEPEESFNRLLGV